MLLDFADFDNVEMDGVDIKRIELDGLNVWTRVDMPVITTQPVGGTVDDDEEFSVSIVADDGDGTLTYQWFINNIAEPDSNSADYTFDARPVGNYPIRCEVTNRRGTVVSESVILVVVEAYNPTHTMTIATFGSGPYAGFSYTSDFGTGGSVSTRYITGISPAMNALVLTDPKGGFFDGFVYDSGVGAPLGVVIRVTWEDGGVRYTENSEPGKSLLGVQYQFAASSQFRDFIWANVGNTVQVKLEVL